MTSWIDEIKEHVRILRKRQRATLEQIFAQPVLASIKWSDVESLIKSLGREVKEGRGSRCKFILNQSIASFHRPHPSPDTDKGAVMSLREWLESIGVKP